MRVRETRSHDCLQNRDFREAELVALVFPTAVEPLLVVVEERFWQQAEEI